MCSGISSNEEKNSHKNGREADFLWNWNVKSYLKYSTYNDKTCCQAVMLKSVWWRESSAI